MTPLTMSADSSWWMLLLIIRKPAFEGSEAAFIIVYYAVETRSYCECMFKDLHTGMSDLSGFHHVTAMLQQQKVLQHQLVLMRCSKLQGNVMQHPDSELPRQAVLVFMEVGFATACALLSHNLGHAQIATGHLLYMRWVATLSIQHFVLLAMQQSQRIAVSRQPTRVCKSKVQCVCCMVAVKQHDLHYAYKFLNSTALLCAHADLEVCSRSS